MKTALAAALAVACVQSYVAPVRLSARAVSPLAIRGAAAGAEGETTAWEPPEFEANREAARARKEKYAPMDKGGAKRRILLEQQRAFKDKAREKPAFLPLVPAASLANASTGDWFPGVVRALKAHGAWVSIGAEIDGFVHCRDFSRKTWVDDGRESFLSVGQTVDVCVKGADAAKRVLSLSLLPVEDAAAVGARKDVRGFEVGQKIDAAAVTRVTPYAAYVEIGATVQGYLHVADIGLLPRSRIGAPRVSRLVLDDEPGQTVPTCWVKSVDIARDRIRLTTIPPDEQDDWTLRGAGAARDAGTAELRAGPADDDESSLPPQVPPL